MRRREHAQSREFAEMVMDKCRYATLSLADEAGLPYGVPLSPVRRGEDLYFHCALEGRKVDLLRKNHKVALVFVGHLQDVPGAFTQYYECAMATGTAFEVTDADERREALRLLCLKYCPDDMDSFDRVMAAWSAKTGVWRIHLETVTSKSNFAHS